MRSAADNKTGNNDTYLVPRTPETPVAGSRDRSHLLAATVYLGGLYLLLFLVYLYQPHSRAARFVIFGAVLFFAVRGALEMGIPHRHRTRASRKAASHDRAPAWRSGSRTLLSLAAQLTPIIALALVFPIVGTRLAAVKFGHTSLSSVLLAAALSVPWLAQIGCAPLYRAIGEDIYNNGPTALVRSFLSRWPAVFVSSIPAVAVLDLSFTIVFRWSRGASLAYLLFGVVSLALTQWFVVPVMEHRYWLWAVTWVAYALALLLAPRLYVLPPCAGLVVLVTAVVRGGARGHITWTHGVGRRLLEGAVLGNLIWVNPLIAYFALGGHFHAAQIFLSLLPAVLLYNFYFVVNAPKVNDYFEKLQHTLQDDPVRSLFDAAPCLVCASREKDCLNRDGDDRCCRVEPDDRNDIRA